MFLHGVDGARLEWGDALNDPKLVEDDSLMKFDAVPANWPRRCTCHRALHNGAAIGRELENRWVFADAGAGSGSLTCSGRSIPPKSDWSPSSAPTMIRLRRL